MSTEEDQTPRSFSFSRRAQGPRQKRPSDGIATIKKQYVTIGMLVTFFLSTGAAVQYVVSTINDAVDAIDKRIDKKVDSKQHYTEKQIKSISDESVNEHEEKAISKSHPEMKQATDEIKDDINEIKYMLRRMRR